MRNNYQPSKPHKAPALPKVAREDILTARTMTRYGLDAETARMAVALAEERKAKDRAEKLSRMVEVPADIAKALAALAVKVKPTAAEQAAGLTASSALAQALALSARVDYVVVKQVYAALADYKHPRRIRIRWEEFNKTSTSKIKRYLYAMDEAIVD